jgi:ADP-ribosyl-[dinitrogen reductase] hydrolase
MTAHNTSKSDRYRGCLLGLAVGDAVGTTLEFRRPGTFAPITDMVGGGPFNLKPGEWTDDTSMALCLAESLVECNGFDAKDQVERYLRWRDSGHLSSTGECFDIGSTVSSALDRYRRTGEPFSGSTDPHTAGNGSIMRLAPVPMWYGADFAKAVANSGLSSMTTHGEETAIDSCRYLGGLVWGALNGVGKDELLSSSFEAVPGYWRAHPLCTEIEQIARGSYKDKNPPMIRGSGYVVESLEAALWAFHRSDNFRNGCLLSANLGNDADTTAAIYGQLAGAYYGADAIPEEWVNRLAMQELIEDLAMKIATLVPE